MVEYADSQGSNNSRSNPYHYRIDLLLLSGQARMAGQVTGRF